MRHTDVLTLLCSLNLFQSSRLLKYSFNSSSYLFVCFFLIKQINHVIVSFQRLNKCLFSYSFAFKMYYLCSILNVILLHVYFKWFIEEYGNKCKEDEEMVVIRFNAPRILICRSFVPYLKELYVVYYYMLFARPFYILFIKGKILFWIVNLHFVLHIKSRLFIYKTRFSVIFD